MLSFHDILTSIMSYFGRYRIIYDRIDEKPYLERYYLFLKDRETFPFNIFLHRFLKSDPDDLHNHPWSFLTIILYGGYWEYTDAGKFWRAPFSYRYAPANTYHRVELDKNVPHCWTLFLPGKKVQDWGFKTKDGWVQNEKYLKKKKEENNVNNFSKLDTELDKIYEADNEIYKNIDSEKNKLLKKVD